MAIRAFIIKLATLIILSRSYKQSRSSLPSDRLFPCAQALDPTLSRTSRHLLRIEDRPTAFVALKHQSSRRRQQQHQLSTSTLETFSMPRGVKKENLPSKVCIVCERPFTWRKKWESCWDEVTTCSKSCNNKRRTANQQEKRQMKRLPSTSSVLSTAVVDELRKKEECASPSSRGVAPKSHIRPPVRQPEENLDQIMSTPEELAAVKQEVAPSPPPAPYEGRMYSDEEGPFVRSYSDDNEDYAPEQNVLEDIQLLSVDTFDILQSFERDVVKSPAAEENDSDTESHASSACSSSSFAEESNQGPSDDAAQRKAERKAAKKAKKAERRAQREGRGDKRTGQKSCDICDKSVNLLIRCTVDESQKWKMVCGKCWNGVSGGVVDGDANHPHYKYGGLWKNRREQQT